MRGRYTQGVVQPRRRSKTSALLTREVSRNKGRKALYAVGGVAIAGLLAGLFHVATMNDPNKVEIEMDPNLNMSAHDKKVLEDLGAAYFEYLLSSAGEAEYKAIKEDYIRRKGYVVYPRPDNVPP